MLLQLHIFSRRSKNPLTFSDCLPSLPIIQKMWFNLFPSNGSTAHLNPTFLTVFSSFSELQQGQSHLDHETTLSAVVKSQSS